VLRLSTTKCQRVAAGSLATVWRMWATKASAVRVGPYAGAMTRPVATSRLRMKVAVPWRTYANARRSTWPGARGRPGGVRSSACTPVNSSLLTIRAPAAARAGAAAYRPQTAATFGARSGAGAGVSQERRRCGWSAPL